MNYFQIGKAKILNICVSVVTTRRVGLADLPPGPRQFVRRCCVLFRYRSLGLVSRQHPRNTLLLVQLIHTSVSALALRRSDIRRLSPQGGNGKGQLKFDPLLSC
ncbi:hypothetical protein T09_250 [Trichinella sp. T9]|nr:hypothetical protein T09_3520 [Trichinella sp. T9]KRX67799.1 hypothetical protein T09_10598 [Trichinella sp. T9]KRX67854.1 hypothetical protein T09_250 [Trichinella sp. T9]